jgi:MFS family permease
VRALQPFRTRQYRILASALTMSLLGAGVWLVAVVWQVVRLGGGPSELSLVATGSSVGMLVAVLFGGVAADRVPQKWILVGTEATKAVAIGAAAALAMADSVEVWHLAIVATVIGLTEGFFYPAYSALLPSVLPGEQLLAANGVEGVLRPAMMAAAGPALAAAIIAAAQPGLAMALVAGTQALALLALLALRTTPVRRDEEAPTSLLGDLRDGFRYMASTPWLLGTLLFATVLILLILGPIEVLLPFAVRDQTGGGATAFAIAIGAFGVGGAIGSIVVASLPLPRRYLTLMVLLWGVGSAPLVVIGYADRLWPMAVALFLTGFTGSAAQVIWGTLLQRRVPPALLGRVSSLDFFVSLLLMPVSMALAGPVGERVGYAAVFLVAGTVPILLAVITVLAARMPADEVAHPLDAALPADSDAIAPHLEPAAETGVREPQREERQGYPPGPPAPSER